jgi:hypothetical protein
MTKLGGWSVSRLGQDIYRFSLSTETRISTVYIRHLYPAQGNSEPGTANARHHFGTNKGTYMYILKAVLCCYAYRHPQVERRA